MAQVDLLISGVISENTATPASNMESDDGNTCNFLNTQIALVSLDDMPSNVDAITSATIHIQGNVAPTKTIANIDLKLLTSGGTMLREDAFNVDAPTAVNYTSDTWTTYIDGGATSTWDTTVVNDMRLQVKHAGNISGTPTFLADFAFVRIVYTETAIPPTVKLTSGKVIITNGKVSV
jgi:hypothetical protein